MHGIRRHEFETEVQGSVDQRNPIGEYLKYIVTNSKELEGLRFWAILGILGVLFFLAMMGTR